MTTNTSFAVPVDWTAPEFALGQTVYLAGMDREFIVTGLRYDLYQQAWCYLLSYQWARGWSKDGREYEAGELSATPWCEYSGLCGRIATTEVQCFTEELPEPYTLRLCAECAAEQQEVQP